MSTQSLGRAAYKATNVSASLEADEKLSVLIGKEKDEQVPWHKFDQGSNYFRFLPPHVGFGDLYAFPKVTCRLPIYSDEVDKEGNKTGRRIIVSKQVFNSKVHGLGGKDLVEEYIRLVKEKAKQMYPNKTEQDTYLKPVRGAFSNDKNLNIQGIEYVESWIAYAVKMTNTKHVFGKLEFKKAVKNRLNEIGSSEAEEDPMGLDPFTDLEEGRAVKIVYDKNATKPQDYYKVEIYAPNIQGTGGKVKLFPIPDDCFEKYEASDPLLSVYVECFKRRDLDLQIEGLKNFDSKYRFGVISTIEFLEILEELDQLYPLTVDVNPNASNDSDLPFGGEAEPVQNTAPKAKLETPLTVPAQINKQTNLPPVSEPDFMFEEPEEDGLNPSIEEDFPNEEFSQEQKQISKPEPIKEASQQNVKETDAEARAKAIQAKWANM